jgi:hypothetical protein
LIGQEKGIIIKVEIGLLAWQFLIVSRLKQMY